jgi:L-alanine-DL-glutamate epimerase-like enolase superfamily enzyme
MKIERIEVYHQALLLDYEYTMSRGRTLSEWDNTIVAVVGDNGVTGWGEACPCGNNYLPVHAGGVRAALDLIGPHLLGRNALNIQTINDEMDWVLPGHPYPKSAIDIACWDALGQVTGLSVCELLGGRYEEPTNIVTGICTRTPDAMLAQIEAFRSWGCRRFSCKIAGETEPDAERLHAIIANARPGESYIADANCSYSQFDAIRLVEAMSGTDLTFEQLCASHDQCLAVRRLTGSKTVLDEIINSPSDVFAAIRDQAADVINIKISRVGGLTKARRLRDLCIDFGLAVTLQDAGGTDIIRSAIANLAQSTPPKLRHSLWDPMECHSFVLSQRRGAEFSDGFLSALQEPGLGITPEKNLLGEPAAIYA